VKKVSYIVLSLLITLNCYSQKDKALHFSAGFVVSGLSSLGKSKNEKIVIGVGSSFAVGIAKEAYDKNRGGKFDMNDIWFTATGGLFGTIIFSYVIKPKRIKNEKDIKIRFPGRRYYVDSIIDNDESKFNGKTFQSN
jgi:hypothetical protein